MDQSILAFTEDAETLELVGPGSEAHRLDAGGAAIGFPLLGPPDKLLKRAGGNSGERAA